MSRSTCACASSASALARSAGSTRNTDLGGLFGGGGRCNRSPRRCGTDFEPFDFAERNVAGAAPIELLFGFQFLDDQLEISLGLTDLPVGLLDFGSCNDNGGLDFGDLASGCFQGGLLLRTVQPEDR